MLQIFTNRWRYDIIYDCIIYDGVMIAFELRALNFGIFEFRYFLNSAPRTVIFPFELRASNWNCI